MNPTLPSPRRFALSVAALLLVVACGSSEGAGWTFAPLGPSPSTAPSPGASPGGSPGASPGGSPGGSPGAGTTFDVVTPQSSPLAFEPNLLEMPAGTEVTVNYLNDSDLPHNINFFNGADNTAPSLAMTPDVTGPGALESVTFTTPAEPGTYFFWCDVHGNAMVGSWRVS